MVNFGLPDAGGGLDEDDIGIAVRAGDGLIDVAWSAVAPWVRRWRRFTESPGLLVSRCNPPGDGRERRGRCHSRDRMGHRAVTYVTFAEYDAIGVRA